MIEQLTKHIGIIILRFSQTGRAGKMEKKLLTCVDDFNAIMKSHVDGIWDYNSKTVFQPESYPCVILYEFRYNQHGSDWYNYRFVYPSDFVAEEEKKEGEYQHTWVTVTFSDGDTANQCTVCGIRDYEEIKPCTVRFNRSRS